MSFKIGSLFDGSGGFPLAASLCGGTPIWASEVEPYPIAVTKSRFPNMKHLGSVTDVKGNEVEPVDVITFGSPCQDLSVAGKRAGLKHTENGDEETTRSGLFMEAVRIIKEMREATNGAYPRFAVWENVPGAFSSNKGEDFRTVCEELIKIVEPGAVMPAVPKNGWPYADCYCGEGWSLAYRVLDSQFWGVPQRRRRCYLVLDLGGECAGQVSFEREGLRGYFAEGRTPWQGTASDAENSVGADDRAGKCVIAVDQGGGKSGANFHHNLSPTLTCTHGGEPAVAYTLKIRSGCEGGGKGALIQTDKSATLATNNDQYLFQPITLEPGIAQCEGGHIYEGVSGTLRANAGDNQMAVAYGVTDCHILDDQGGQQIGVRTDGKSPTLRAEMHGNIPSVLMTIPIHDQATRFSGKRSDKYDGKGNGLGVGNPGEPMNTLTSGDRHAVCYANTYQKVTGPLMANSHPGSYCGQDAYQDMLVVGKEQTPIVFDKEVYNSGENATGGHYISDGGIAPTLRTTGHPPGVCVRYIVRRLTPTECARLQGFADAWAVPDSKEELTDEEYRFWLTVRNTHAEINGKAVKDYTKAQMLTWYNKLHTDSSEYKLWGNGIALPTALYVMQGIADVLNQ